jgi:tetratricopeptide (TPR) repeat protein
LKKDQLAFLFGGLAFGFLLGFGLFKAIETRPGASTAEAASAIPSPAGPAAPNAAMGGGVPQAGGGAPQGGGGGAPMMAEINALKDRVTKNRSDADAWTRLGNIYHDAGMFDQAIEFYLRATEIRPNDAAVLTDTGICYQQLRQNDKALEMFERAQKADPSNWQSLYNTVVVAGLEMGRFDKADAAMARLQEIRPDAPNLAQLKQALDGARSAVPAPATR